MKLQRSPLILLITALILGSGVWLYETQKAPPPNSNAKPSQRLFGFEESEVQALTLTTPTKNFAFVRSATPTASPSKPPSPKSTATPSAPPSVWKMTAPTKTDASDGTIAYLLNLMASGTRQETTKIPASKKAEFGLEPPAATAEVKLFNQQTHRIVLGKANFNRSGLYAQIDPPADPAAELEVALVSIDFANAVDRPRGEWLAQADLPQPQATPSQVNSSPASAAPP